LAKVRVAHATSLSIQLPFTGVKKVATTETHGWPQ